MLRWPNNQGVMGDDPPYLVVGTEVSAKYKGAFCEAKVRKVVRSVKCKVNFKVGGSAIVTDDQIRGTLRASSVVEAKHPDRKEFVEACITKIQDCSQYTVVFDDGDITTLRRTALCLKSGRHFAESETLDQLPLTHPEHFGNPVVGNRRGGRRSRNPMSDESSDEEEEPPKGKSKEEKEADIGKVICVELGDKKKQKDNWFPGLVVHPAAQDVVRIRVKDEYLVRSFKDGRYFTVPKKETSEFNREIGSKVDNNSLKTAVDKALQYLDKDELPPHWDREVLFGLEDASTASDSDAAFDSDSSDDEPREEKDHFVAQLYKFMDDRGTPINRGPMISGRDVDLYKLFKVVHKLGGCNRVTNHNQWKMVSHKVGFGQFSNTANLVRVAYKKYLHSFEDFYRKLGCTMVNHPRGNRVRHRGGRSLIRDKDRATPVNVPRGDGKDKGSDTIDDDDDDSLEKAEGNAELSGDEKDDESTKPRENKEAEASPKLSLGPPILERKPSDLQLKVGTPRGKPKRQADGPGIKNTSDMKKKTVQKVKGVRPVDDNEEEESDLLDVEDLENEDEDKLTTTRSKAKEESGKPKSDVKSVVESEKKTRVVEGNEKRIKPSLTVTGEKKIGRPSSTAPSDKKGKSTQDGERKTVRSLTAEFEKKSRGSEVDKKEALNPEGERRPRTYSLGDNEKKVRPSMSASVERKKSSAADLDKKSRQGGTDPEKKIRPSLTADPERKKVRPSLTADPTKKVSRIDTERKRDKVMRSSEADDVDKKSKFHESDRKISNPETSRSNSVVESDRKSSKSDSGDSDRRGSSKSRKGEEDKRKQHARKRKDNDEAGNSSVDDSLDLLPNYKNVCIGDKLKVYYGPTHESKVTYEAKVLEVEGEGSNESYLVHYTGWNNRYDEWIKRSRIADNVSWSPARGKRRHLTQTPAAKKPLVKKRTLTPGRDGGPPLHKDQYQSSPVLPGSEKPRDPQPPRSSTPSSVTSSSSRTKSPALRLSSARVTRNTVGDTAQQTVEQASRRKRTRRSSGQTDMPSDSESDGSGSGSEVEPSTTRKSARRLAIERDEDSIVKERVPKKKMRKREAEVEADDDEDKDGDKEELKDDTKDDDDASCESLSQEKLTMKRPKKGAKGSADRKADIKIEIDEEEASANSSSKGIDPDLNPIRSEVKGMDKAVKTSPLNEEADSDSVVEPDIDVDTASLLENKASTLIEPGECTFEMEDIYEFKEPEPFEFEVRSKREPSVERTPKLQKRPLPRIFDDLDPVIKKKPKSTVGDSESSADEGVSPVKKKPRQTVNKKDDSDKTEAESPSSELNAEKIALSDQTTPQKKLAAPSEDAFEKLRQSPSFRFTSGSPLRALTPTSSITTVVPAPLQSPPQLTSAPSSTIVASSVGTSNKPGSSITSNPPPVSQSTVKLVPVQPLKPVTSVPALRTTSPPSSSLKPVPSQEVKFSASTKPVLVPPPKVVSSPVPSRPPVLAAAVKVPSESDVITKSEEWLKGKQVDPEKTESKKDNLTTIKIETDDSLPPLVPTALTVPSCGRSSPDPPQLLPMSGLAPQLLQETCKVEPVDVQMPQIKKETVVDVEAVSSSIKHSLVSVRSQTPVLVDDADDMSEDDSLPKSNRRKAQIKRKKAVSKEFVEDSDSDSSDEERRLVIDRSESSDSASESDEMKISISLKDNDSKWKGGSKEETGFEQEKSKSLQKGDNVSLKSKEMSSSNPSEDEVTEESSTLKVEDTEEVEIDNNVCSLFCEETIPGSPAPPCDTPVDVNTESSSSRSSDRILESSKASCKVLEMPFASVPGNTRSSGPSSSSSPATTFTKTCRSEKGELTQTDVVSAKAGSSCSSMEAAPFVIANTPPTTPDSSMSTLSNSPRGEHGDTLSIMDNDSTKSHRDSEDPENKDNDYSDDDLDVGTRMKRLSEKKENDQGKGRYEPDSMSPNKKRRRSGKSSEGEDRAKRPRHSSNRMSSQGVASDSDDNSETTTSVIPAASSQTAAPIQTLQTSTLPHSSASASTSNTQTQASRSPRPSKYNFFVELAPELDASQRIALLQNTLQELRKTYATVKQQLACIDRRRKKLRRREREARLEARKMMREERRQAREEVVSCS